VARHSQSRLYVLGELAVAAGFLTSMMLETPIYLVLASISWIGFGLALPLAEATDADR
jgi:hypothetical protein